jgi:hypothetical protein
MQLAHLSSDVAMSNVGKTTKFKIAANAKMFRLLSDTMYQNKIGSIVREVSCNAWDSHMAAGYPERPFEIHLPDTFEPYFSVRDYGIGLDGQGVEEVFTTYGESTKDHSNDFVGAFGLGSKSPFAYTDAFTVTAVKDGVQRTYTAYVGEDGEPAVTELDVSPTTECNGVTITIPVTSPADFARFRQEVQNQLTFFTTKPVVHNAGSNPVQWMEWEGASQYMNCENVFIGGNNTSFRGVWIIQGIVGYRMDVGVVKEYLRPENKEFLDIISNAALLKFDLGEIEVIGSREGISYKERTLANIEKVLDKARQNIKATVQAEIDGIASPWEKAMALNTRDHLRRLAKIAEAGFTAHGYEKIHGTYYLNLEDIVRDPKAPAPTVDPNTGAGLNIPNLYFSQYTREYVRRKTRWQENGKGKQAKVDTSVRVLVRDTADKPVVRIREYMGNLGHISAQVFVLQNRDGSVVTPAQLKLLADNIGEGFTFEYLSKVELPEPDARPRNGYKSPTAYTYNKGDDLDSARHWEREYEAIKEFEEGAYYVVVDRLSLSVPYKCRVVTMMADAGILDKPIMAIRRKDVDRVTGNANWVPLETKADEVIAGVAANKALINAYAMSQCSVSGTLMDYGANEYLTAAYNEGLIPKSSVLYKFFKCATVVTRVRNRATRRGFSAITVEAMRHVPNVPQTAGSIEKLIRGKLDKAKEEALNAYPLLRYMNGYRMGDEAKNAMLEYITLKGGV